MCVYDPDVLCNPIDGLEGPEAVQAAAHTVGMVLAKGGVAEGGVVVGVTHTRLHAHVHRHTRMWVCICVHMGRNHVRTIRT